MARQSDDWRRRRVGSHVRKVASFIVILLQCSGKVSSEFIFDVVCRDFESKKGARLCVLRTSQLVKKKKLQKKQPT